MTWFSQAPGTVWAPRAKARGQGEFIASDLCPQNIDVKLMFKDQFNLVSVLFKYSFGLSTAMFMTHHLPRYDSWQ